MKKKKKNNFKGQIETTYSKRKFWRVKFGKRIEKNLEKKR